MLGQFIRERRVELGLTQEQLAERVGDNVRQAEISRLERDRVSLPRRARMERLAKALEVSLGTLLLRTGWMDEEQSIRDALVHMPAAIRPPAPYLEPVIGETYEPNRSGEEIILLNAALSRAREVARRTEDVLRESTMTVDHARRTRRQP
ncbi:MAG TPA: helix-turn-helix transcriptional regulator [Thermomicrobiales bacterium]|nr:helix-turn-helix transcriptional regulator [Thermomicrobiales bacterium]